MVQSRKKTITQSRRSAAFNRKTESRKAQSSEKQIGFQKMLGVFALGMFCMLLIGYGIHLVLYPAGSCVSYPKRCCCRVVPSCSFVEQNRMAPYIPAEYAPYLKAGSKRIEGRLNPDMNVRVHRRYQPENYRSSLPEGARRVRAKTVDAAALGSQFLPVVQRVEVFANPVTAYSREWFNRNWAGRENLKPADKRVWKTHFKGQIGPDGQFVLDHLPAGEYFVAARACVQFHPRQKGCKEVRFGKRVRTDGKQPVVLDVVFREK